MNQIIIIALLVITNVAYSSEKNDFKYSEVIATNEITNKLGVTWKIEGECCPLTEFSILNNQQFGTLTNVFIVYIHSDNRRTRIPIANYQEDISKRATYQFLLHQEFMRHAQIEVMFFDAKKYAMINVIFGLPKNL